MKRIMFSFLTALLATVVMAGEISSTVKSLPGEVWYGAYTSQAFNGTSLDKIIFQPFPAEYAQKDLRYDNNSNQAAPLLISNMGRYVWSDCPFAFSLHKGNLLLASDSESIKAVQTEGNTLRDAYMAAMKLHFPPSGKTPAPEMFHLPQYNTWIELGHDQNQKKILEYARDVIKNGFPTGVFMIDDQWAISYGALDFNREYFPDPKAMVDEMHDFGFKVMVWVSPFISPDSPEFRELEALDALVKRADNGRSDIIKWWNGCSACLDLTKKSAIDWLKGKLDYLQSAYGIDGFKFDAADFDFYTSKSDVFPNVDSNADPNEQCRLYTLLGTEYPFSEMRASWKGGNLPVSQRLQDKGYSWDDLQLIVPDMVSAGLIGLPFTCPDMIGGGLLSTFEGIDFGTFDQELIIRSAQAQVMMPMMQFSAAPWRILDAEHLELCRQAALRHVELGDEIYRMALDAAENGEPIVRHMEYAFPHQGFERCRDQYVLGGKYIVAPVLNKGGKRNVVLPEGTWVDDEGKEYKGGRTYTISAALGRLPYFVSKKSCSTHDRKVILLRSGWQIENIGDVSHTPGFLALAEKYIPDADVIWWPFYGLLPDSEVEMLAKRFPKLSIVRGYLNDDGTPSNKELGDAIMKADIFIHNSGPSTLSWREALLFKKMTGKPFGVYGVTYGLYGTPEKDALSEAAFVYFRDTLSLEAARRDGIHCPVMGFAPDAAFGVDIEDGTKAEALLEEYGLEPGKFICCNPNQRRTPFWEHTFKGRAFDQSVQDLNDSMRDHDHNPMLEAITRIARETDLKIFIVHEDQTELKIGKEWILDKLPEDVRKRCVWLDRYWTLDEAIGVFKRSAGLFSHEMHCPIMCIANGIPAIVVRWKEQSTKGYMWETIGLGQWLFDFDNEDDVAGYVPTVLEFARNTGKSVETALKAKAFVNKCQKESFDQVFDSFPTPLMVKDFQ